MRSGDSKTKHTVMASRLFRPLPSPGLLLTARTRSFGTLALPLNPLPSLWPSSFRFLGLSLPAWLSPILWAVPKKKTSHSKKRMRASNKGLRNLENIITCPGCGNPKLMHHLCVHCYKDVRKKAKEVKAGLTVVAGAAGAVAAAAVVAAAGSK
ncbi:hypothetical protein BC937DRAFT_86822 [Endogone sp. FLAS-F59071]|nr:hypothetical protein BC937DRAFT_86822 [Endogone sp. FLAS-F59071]|eukprot:RUS19843.1 hypothetical protein BC937DRAFT_86822 [Endogone sp. FLAS-F59071]